MVSIPQRPQLGYSSGKLKLEVTPIATPGQGPHKATLHLRFSPRAHWPRPWLAWRDFGSRRPTIRAYAFAGLCMALIGAGITAAIYSHKLTMLEEQLRQAQRSQQQLLPTGARAIISYKLIRDDQRARGSETAPIPEISLRLHSAAVSLEIPLLQSNKAESYTAELDTFTGEQTLMTQNSLRPVRTAGGGVVEIIVPNRFVKGGYLLHGASAFIRPN